MKRFTSILRLFILIGLTAATFSSCVKKEYDEPDTANMDPTDLVVTHTLDQFQNRLQVQFLYSSLQTLSFRVL
ncbi:MAG: hypothetical protein IPG90_00660 [Bacteroidetes bacterium]|nr:hypothetical protein [Bacteroidota bacterium]